MIVIKSDKRAELFCAYAIDNYLFQDKDFTVGDCSGEHLPDIYESSLSLGVEVVQLEKDCDLNTKYIWKAYRANNGDYKSVKKFCDDNYKGVYRLTNLNGKVSSFSPNEDAHDVDWMKDIYKKNLTNKLNKLNIL